MEVEKFFAYYMPKISITYVIFLLDFHPFS